VGPKVMRKINALGGLCEFQYFLMRREGEKRFLPVPLLLVQWGGGRSVCKNVRWTLLAQPCTRAELGVRGNCRSTGRGWIFRELTRRELNL